MKSRHQVFDIDIYNVKLVVVETKKADYLETVGIEPHLIDPEVFGHCFYGGHEGRTAIFIVVNTRHERYKPSVLVHECVHAANMIFAHIDYKVDPNNDESQAYLVDHIFEKANTFINGRSKTK